MNEPVEPGDPEDVNDYEEDMSEAARLRFEIMDAEDRNGTGPDGHSY